MLLVLDRQLIRSLKYHTYITKISQRVNYVPFPIKIGIEFRSAQILTKKGNLLQFIFSILVTMRQLSFLSTKFFRSQ
jgi:hypothetical protein